MDVHPYCAILPDMLPGEYAALLNDIKVHGLRDPIMTYNNTILDGRHRWRACEELQLTPRVVPFVGDDAAALAWVKSRNMRRHLHATQRAWVARAFLEQETLMAKMRQCAGLRQGQHAPVGEFVPGREKEQGRARDRAGAAMGVSGRLVTQAATIAKTAAPCLAEAIKSGLIHMPEAFVLAKLSPKTQQRLVAMADPAGRKHATACALNRMRGKRRGPRCADELLPSTPFARAFLNQVERAGIYTKEQGCPDTATAIARLRAEIDWSSAAQRGQFARCEYTATIMWALCEERNRRVEVA
ncbi:ParB/RepB/Spo0J family partition protein [Dyella japonica]|uniref:ParB/Sulfiredoxin domain-containing protein n=1 Tax=Dyella japonica TaxID=231455 RepID=A0ABV2K0U5_9GAMM